MNGVGKVLICLFIMSAGKRFCRTSHDNSTLLTVQASGTRLIDVAFAEVFCIKQGKFSSMLGGQYLLPERLTSVRF